MISRFGFSLVIGLLVVSASSAQVVRFETTVGSFDMVLNPTNNARLRAQADNMVRYVENGNYNSSWINRADTGFVLQMGGFYSHTRRPPPTIDSTRPLATFAPVQGAPGITGLSNTIGTVALALPGLPGGGTNRNAGTSSFFVNLTSNTFLDPDFTVFAAISDMTVINQIMALMTIDRTTDPVFGAGGGNLGFSDVPVTGEGQQVFIRRAFVINDTLSVARAMAAVAPLMATSASAAGGAGSGASASLAASAAVPEPASVVLLLSALGFGLAVRRRRRT